MRLKTPMSSSRGEISSPYPAASTTSANTATKRRQRPLSGGRMSRIPGLVWNVDTAGQATGGPSAPEMRLSAARRTASEHAVGPEHPVEDVTDHRLFAPVVR